jgi:hypothetical protein
MQAGSGSGDGTEDRGAKAMDDLFKAHQEASKPPNLPPHPVRTKQSGIQ